MPTIINVPGGGGSKVPKTLPPINEISCERNGDKINLTIKKMTIDRNTNMLQGGALYYKSTLPDTVGDGTERTFSRSELLTSGKPYDGLYLGDITASDAATETILWLPENENGKIKLVPFIVLSVNYLGGVYVTRKYAWNATAWGEGSNPQYASSRIDSLLTNTYLNSIIHDSVSNAIIEVEYPMNTASTSNVVTRKVIALSASENGFSGHTDGTIMPYFTTVNNRILKNENGSAVEQWTRSKAAPDMVYYITQTGSLNSAVFQGNKYARPAFVLPKDFKIQQRPDGSYTVYGDAGLITLNDIDASTETVKVTFQVPLTEKSTQNTIYRKYVYAKGNYRDSENGLLVSDDVNFMAADMQGTSFIGTNAYGMLKQFKSAKSASEAINISFYLHSIIQSTLSPTNIPYSSSGGTISTSSESCFLLSAGELGASIGGVSPNGTGPVIPYYSAQGNRLFKDGTGAATAAWTRDRDGAVNRYYYVARDGGIGTVDSTSVMVLVPCITVPMSTYIRALADGTYDLVPNDPSLISTYAPDSPPDGIGEYCTLRDVPISDDNLPVVRITENSASATYLMTFNGYGGDTQAGVLVKAELSGAGKYDTDSSPSPYPDSDIDKWCISFVDRFPEEVKKHLKTTSIPYTTSSNSVSTINRNCFVLSHTELGLTASGVPALGTASPYFAKSASNRIRKWGMIANTYWTRTYQSGSNSSIKVINASGEMQDSYAANAGNYYLPAISLSLDSWVERATDGSYLFLGDEPDQNDTINMEIPWPENEEFYARMFTYNGKKQWQTMLSNAVATTNPEWGGGGGGIVPDPILGNNTPEQIQAAVDQGIYKELWSVGDELTIFVGDANYTFQLAAFDHDPITGASKTAAMTFIMKNLMNTKQKMNTTNTNTTSFAGSVLNSYLVNTLYPSFPEEWKAIIKTVDKKTSAGNESSNIRTDSYNLFIPSEVEVFGTTAQSFAGEGAVYPLFSTGSYRVKKLANGTGAADWWWLRSPRSGNSSNFCVVTASGSPGTYLADRSGGVCLGFCV